MGLVAADRALPSGCFLRSAHRTRCSPHVTVKIAASHRVGRDSRVCSTNELAPHWFSASAMMLQLTLPPSRSSLPRLKPHDQGRSSSSSHVLGVAFRERRGRVCAPGHHHCGKAVVTMTRHTRPPMEFWWHFDASSRKQRPTPGFHTRLCGAFRFSQPLDALLRSQPFRSCFVPVAPLCFRVYSGLPPAVASAASQQPLSPMPFPEGHIRRDDRRARLRGFAHPQDPSLWAGVTRDPETDPLMTLSPPRYDLAGLGPTHNRGTSVHGLDHAARRRRNAFHQHDRSSTCQRTSEAALLFRGEPPSLGSLVHAQPSASGVSSLGPRPVNAL
jgi:hypothetical protein